MSWPPTCKICGKPGPKNRWEKIRAQEEGWFIQKNEDMFCPDDTPEWVAEWRRKKAEKNDHTDG